MTTSAAVSGLAWCTFRLAGRDYGVELARVLEVLRPQPITRLPLSPPAIAGLLNLRGRIVPVVDPRVVLGAARPSLDARGGLVVVSGDDGPVALLVDAIGDVRRADPAAPVLASLPGSAGHPDAGRGDDASPLVACTLALPGELLNVLDLDGVLARAFATPGMDGTRP